MVQEAKEKMKIIDVHAHIFPDKIAEKAVAAIGHFYDIEMGEKGTSEVLLSEGSAAGTYRYVVHSVATTPKQVHAIDDFIAYECSIHPEFIGFASLHPDYEDLPGEIERIQELGLAGVKFHPDFQEFYIDDKKAIEMYEKIPTSMPILLHMGDEKRKFSQPERLAKVMDILPEHKFIAAHFGGYSAWDEAEEFLIGKNVYMDSSSALFKLEPERAVGMIRRHGAEKFLYGTDFPMWRPEEELQRFNRLALSEEERSMIFYENAAKLFNIE